MKKYIIDIIILSLLILISLKIFMLFPDRHANNDTELLFLDHLSQSVFSDGNHLSSEVLLDYQIRNDLLDNDLLVVRYSDMSCAPCKNYIVSKLSDYYGNLAEHKQVLFIASDFNGSQVEEYGNTVYLRGKEYLGLPLEESNIPFVFIYSNSTVLHSFTPVPGEDDCFDLYLAAINSRYEL